jgi:hypothetical protein
MKSHKLQSAMMLIKYEIIICHTIHRDREANETTAAAFLPQICKVIMNELMY